MKKLQISIVQLFILAALFVTGAVANTVSFDTSFNGTGYSIQDAAAPPANSLGNSMALQPDGKILIAGFTTLNNFTDKAAVMRLNSDGSLDPSFGTGGRFTTNILQYFIINKVLVQPDGKILLAGISSSNDSASDFTLMRLNSNGSLDTSFNSTGYVVQNTPVNTFDTCESMALQADGKIVLVGRTAQIPGTPNFEYNFAVMRFNSNGSLDTGFNGSGILVVGDPGVEESAYAVVVQADGKILIGGLRSPSANNANFLLKRINADGTPDMSFGSSGTTITTASQQYHYIQTLALQSDGKILAGGNSYIARYTTGGVLDTSFAANGVVEKRRR